MSDPHDLIDRTERELARAERLLEIAHVAHRLRVSEEYARRLCRTRKLIAVRLDRRWRVSQAELDAFIRRNTTSCSSAEPAR